jgi:hypothetical protein
VKPGRDLLGGMDAITLPDDFVSHSVDAWRCPDCGTTIIPDKMGPAGGA